MNSPKIQTAGFSLVEVTLAMAVVVFCMAGLMGLLTVGLQGNHAAMSQSAANGIFSAVISDLRATPVTTPPGQPTESPQFQIPIPRQSCECPGRDHSLLHARRRVVSHHRIAICLSFDRYLSSQWRIFPHRDVRRSEDHVASRGRSAECPWFGAEFRRPGSQLV